MKIETQISKKVNGFFKKMNSCKSELSVPDVNNLRHISFSVLKEQQPLLNPLLGLVNIDTSEKHKEKRLRCFIGKRGLSGRLSRDYLHTVSGQCKGLKYCIVDNSDIIKKYGRMEFIKRIYDGSTGDTGYGYHTLNILGSDVSGEILLPLYSELYSMKEPGMKSENRKTLDAISLVSEHVDDGIYVMDRGFDRNVLYKEFIKNDTHFITRLKNQRHLDVDGVHISFDSWRKHVDLSSMYESMSISQSGSLKRKTFRVGCRRVSLDLPGASCANLWLVVMKRVKKGITRSQGYSYYLAFLPEHIKKKKDVIDIVTRGYGHRWRIEEYHRFLKTEMNFEKMRFARYEALKTMTVIMMISAYFIFTGLKKIFMERIMKTFRKKDWKRYEKGCLKFIYYELARLIKRTIYQMKLYRIRGSGAPPPVADLFTFAGIQCYGL